MGTTLSHGVYKPATPDTGDVWFPAMANNMQILNDHTHNGVDSSLMIGLFTQSILSANWGAAVNGTYTQTITLPIVNTVQLLYDSLQIEFRLSTGEIIYPSITRVSSTSYSVSTNDNTQTYTAFYR